jgi:hypothetical protein
LDEQGGFSVNLPSEPVTDADKKRAVKRSAKGYPQYRPDHPWPEYVRLGYDSMDEFMEGWNWHFSLDQAEGILMLNPSRHGIHSFAAGRDRGKPSLHEFLLQRRFTPAIDTDQRRRRSVFRQGRHNLVGYLGW